MGQTPWEALHDPHADFNFTAFRAYRKQRQMRLALAVQGSKDPLGVLLQLIYEDT